MALTISGDTPNFSAATITTGTVTTLTTTTISDGTNSTSSTNCIQGSAKAWVKFAGSTATINSSYNVSSITRAGTGQYTVNYTNALPSVNYSTTSTCNFTSNGTNGVVMFVTAQATTTCTLIATDLRGSTNYADPSIVCVSISSL